MNANVIGKNDLIGVYQVDSQMVYFQKDHEVAKGLWLHDSLTLNLFLCFHVLAISHLDWSNER